MRTERVSEYMHKPNAGREREERQSCWSEGEREEAHSFLLMFFAFPPPFEHWRRAGVPFRDNEQAGGRKGGSSQSAHLDHWADRGSVDGDGVRSSGRESLGDFSTEKTEFCKEKVRSLI